MIVAGLSYSNHFNISLPQNPNPNPNPNPLFFFSKNSPTLSSETPPCKRIKSEKKDIQIRVCTNRSCTRYGSRETLELLTHLSPPNVSVTSCGCLGRCGSGPNLVVLPGGIFVSHCGTAANAGKLIAELTGGDPSDNLAGLALRKKAEREIEAGNFSEAEILLSQAIDLKPSGGLQFLYKARSAARLALGNNSGALEDAEEAVRISPRWPQAYLCQGDAFFAMVECAAAENAYATALQIDPSIRRSKSFKARIAKLEEKLTSANISS